MTKNQKFGSSQLGETDRAAFGIAKLDLEYAGSEQFNNCPYLTRHQSELRPLYQNGDHIKQLGRAFFHITFIAHSRKPDEGILPRCG